jgi:hypothetical protein
MTRRTALRIAAGAASLTLIGLWIALFLWIFTQADQRPAPAVFMLPIFFVSLAGWIGVAAFRDEPMIMAIAAALSLIPTGLILLFLPGLARLIGVVDLGVLAVAVALLRSGEDVPVQEAAG